MDHKPKAHTEESKAPEPTSPVKTVISWLVQADREFRVAQTMVNDTHKKL